MKLKTLEQFESKDPCECGGNCGCGKSVNENETLCEATVEMDAMDPDSKDFLKFLKKNRVKIINKEMDGPGGGTPVITMQGKRKDLEKVLADPELGWDDPGLAEYIEESDNTFKTVATLEAKKYKFKDLSKAWEFVYGEDMEDEYEGFYQEVVGKYKNKVTKADVANIWQKVYGEDITTDYESFFNDLKENLNQVAKLELLEANSDGTISDDEDERRAELLERVKGQMQELLASAELDAKDIGGSFRSPGIMAEIRKELNSQLKKFR